MAIEWEAAFSNAVLLGAPLDATVRATASDTDSATLTLEVVGGSLTPSEAGFDGSFPLTLTGAGELAMELTGMAAATGTIEFEATVENEAGSDSWRQLVRIKHAPWLAPPLVAGPLQQATSGAFETAVAPGESLDVAVAAGTLEPFDLLELRVVASGGTLSPEDAGFVTALPAEASGVEEVTRTLDGMAAAVSGTVELRAIVDDGVHADMWTLTIHIGTIPLLDAPSGPGTVLGFDGVYTSRIDVGDPLDFQVHAGGGDGALTLSVEVLGGTLTPVAVGFATAFPVQATGDAPLSVALEGEALASGTIILLATVTDGVNEDTWVHSITVNTPPVLASPTGPGQVTGNAGQYEARLRLGDSLEMQVVASDADGDELTITRAA